MTGGVLSGAGNVSVTGTFNYNGGTLTGPGSLNVLPGGVMNIGSANFFNDPLRRNVTNDGTVNFVKNSSISFLSAITNSGDGVMNFQSGCTFTSPANFTPTCLFSRTMA